MSAEDFVQSVVMDLHSTAPPEILAMVSSDMKLMQEVQGLAEDAVEGLKAVADGVGSWGGVAAKLEARKAAILRLAPQFHPTIDALLSKFRNTVVAEARRSAGG